ncbi:MAG: GNAT family N-acetyltransferase [Bacillota bacterium]|nr:GNAT family N-acetyltransferase [Bacillota bacterium]
MINFIPFPNIETKNLILRKMNYKDIDDLFSMRSDSRMNEYIDVKADESTDETKAYIDRMNRGVEENKWIIWAMEHRESEKVIGSVSIWNIDEARRSGELGYGIIPEYQGSGLMKEALLQAVGYGFDKMNLKTLEAYTEEKNIKSIGLLQRCGFIEVNRVDDPGYFSDRVYHMVVYRLEKGMSQGLQRD